MEKYKSLIGKEIELEFNNEILDFFKIINIKQIPHRMPERGRLYRGDVEWCKNKKSTWMEFDEQTLDELLTGRSNSPLMKNCCFKIK